MNIPNELLDAIRAQVFPDGATSAHGAGPDGGRLRLSEHEERGVVGRWLGGLAQIERLKREHHNIYVRQKARVVTEALLDSSGA